MRGRRTAPCSGRWTRDRSGPGPRRSGRGPGPGRRDGGRRLRVPQVEYGVIATRTTEVIVADAGEALTVDAVQQLERGMDDERLQPSNLSLADLPAGPAVRSRRTELAGHVFGNERLAELVSHVIVPEPVLTDGGRPAAIRHVVSWQMLTQGAELAELADDCAALLTIERHPA
jgi:hypothetical protein